MAERLGTKRLIFAYEKPQDISAFKNPSVEISLAIICRPEDARKHKQNFLTISRVTDPEMARVAVEQHKPDIIYGLESQKRADFLHHRASGMNHIIAALAAEKEVTIAFSFADILAVHCRERAILLGRMKQNIEFARKFKFKTRIASFATTPWQMRTAREMIALFETLGLDRRALAGVLPEDGEEER
jgi:RNase P/RNase MRP subunit p30